MHLSSLTFIQYLAGLDMLVITLAALLIFGKCLREIRKHLVEFKKGLNGTPLHPSSQPPLSNLHDSTFLIIALISLLILSQILPPAAEYLFKTLLEFKKGIGL